MLFNIYFFEDSSSFAHVPQYIETVVADDDEKAIVGFAVSEWGRQSLCVPNRWYHYRGSNQVSHRYGGYWFALPAMCCVQCLTFDCTACLCDLTQKIMPSESRLYYK